MELNIAKNNRSLKAHRAIKYVEHIEGFQKAKDIEWKRWSQVV